MLETVRAAPALSFTQSAVPHHNAARIYMEYRTLAVPLESFDADHGHHDLRRRWAVRRRRNSDVSEAKRIIDTCIDAGINLIDTSNVYSNGLSEEIIGEALGGKRKGDVLIASKAPHADRQRPNDEGLSRLPSDPRMREEPEAAQDGCHRHLFPARMGRRDAARETIAALDTLVAQGKIRYAGLLQLFRLASDEGARHQRQPPPAALSSPSNPLHAGSARGRI